MMHHAFLLIPVELFIVRIPLAILEEEGQHLRAKIDSQQELFFMLWKKHPQYFGALTLQTDGDHCFQFNNEVSSSATLKKADPRGKGVYLDFALHATDS